MLADSYWGKYKTIFYLSIVYCAGMALMAVSAVEFDDSGVGQAVNMGLALAALFIIACGTGGIKPCVSTLGGDQFDDSTERGRKHIASFFTVFYFAINAGSLCSTFITPILRDLSYVLAFAVPSILMAVALVLFLVGTPYYIRKPPTGQNVFSLFLGATWNALRNRCKTDKKERDPDADLMSYADKSKYPSWMIRDAKWVWPIVVMYLPIIMFWALFDMQGSRWTLTATQMDGYWGKSFKMRPDQVQLFNSVFILLLLPCFELFIYPCLNIFVKMTPLRRMCAGQVIAALAFVISGFVQLAIQSDLTLVPDFGSDNALVVTNALWEEEMTVSSEYWKNTKYKEEQEDNHEEFCKEDDVCEFTLPIDLEDLDKIFGSEKIARTPTHAWLHETVPENLSLMINDDEYTINLKNTTGTTSGGGGGGGSSCDAPNQSTSLSCSKCQNNGVEVHENQITNLVVYRNEDTKEIDYFQYPSSYEKSQNLQVKVISVNPTKYFMRTRLYKENMLEDEFEYFYERTDKSNDTHTGPYCANTGNAAEFEQDNEGGAYGFDVFLYDSADVIVDDLIAIDDNTYESQLSDKFKEDQLEPIMRCRSEETFLQDEDGLSGGSIWTVMVVANGNECKVSVYRDSNPNTVNIALLLPQYFVITISEVLVSVTGLEFAYNQAPKTMKAVIQSFWLLTTCFGNIIDIFLVAAQMGDNQAQEYFYLAIIMLGTTSIFILLSIFYYEYVDPAIFDEAVDDESDDEKASINKSNRSSISKSSRKSRKSKKSIRMSEISMEEKKEDDEFECEF
ncbi:Oidioi.mRNA.OKI2018_I69.chr1.g1174.t1.cds [Oikopleura dioica]|uniref:Oidioi.mRNA.OKI2018_I69.chr1.g1174.t1.cds n=1 Tax=Oikopleura dioica TaxID=34765 RepID=A0ABN7SM42_OIKDI|nr:Oidioi.mRNA.OKI2018_I69.chr1.g1174.t1.cds [Oikopleura dioica]